jgi:putative chitinase
MGAEDLKFKFTVEQVKQILKGNPDAEKWHAAMMEIFPKYEINTIERVAGFMAQCAHESGNFKMLEENLNYREETLLKIFPRYFGPGKRNAKEYAKNPEMIANYVYMDEFRTSKMGNVKEGDGWRFRGRGLKQLTGRENYTNFGKSVNMTAEQAADYVATEKGAIESACWFWNTKKLNAVADTKDIVKMTKIINGGDIGLADRKERFEEALKVLGGNFTPSASSVSSGTGGASASVTETLKKGSKGPSVAKLQEALGVTADGSFGPGTESALKAWQAKNGLTADGVAGPKTLSKLLG